MRADELIEEMKDITDEHEKRARMDRFFREIGRDRLSDEVMLSELKKIDEAGLITEKVLKRDAWRDFLLQEAILRCPETLGFILDKKWIDINGTIGSYTPLTYAIEFLPYYQKKRIISFLLEAGADANVADRRGKTPLLTEISNGCHREVIDDLLSKGANIDLEEGVDGSKLITPLMAAVTRGAYNASCKLVEKGADFNRVGRNGFSPFSILATKNPLDVWGHSNNYAPIFDLFLSRGADVNQRLPNGRTFLRTAVDNGFDYYVDDLLEKEVEVDNELIKKLSSEQRETAVEGVLFSKLIAGGKLSERQKALCVEYKEALCGQLLDQYGGNSAVLTRALDSHDPLGEIFWTRKGIRSPSLKRGTLREINECLQDLLRREEASARDSLAGHPELWGAPDKSGAAAVAPSAPPLAAVAASENPAAAPLFMAAQEGHLDIVKKLIKAGADVNQAATDGTTPLHIAAYNGHLVIVDSLIAARADVNKARRTDGATPLHMAAYTGHLDIVKRLIKAEADVNQAKTNGATPLSMAAQQGHLDIVNSLIDAGADVNQARRTDGVTPLCIAAQECHLDIVNSLIDAGADVNQAKTNGVTPLHMAAYYGHLDIVNRLIAAEADVNKAMTDGATPLFIARRKGHLAIVDRLIEAGAADIETATDFLKESEGKLPEPSAPNFEEEFPASVAAAAVASPVVPAAAEAGHLHLNLSSSAAVSAALEEKPRAVSVVSDVPVRSGVEAEGPPLDLCDTVSLELMDDPVLVVSERGIAHTYDRSTVREIVSEGGGVYTDPKTRESLSMTEDDISELSVNKRMLKRIEAWMKENPQHKETIAVQEKRRERDAARAVAAMLPVAPTGAIDVAAKKPEAGARREVRVPVGS